MQFEICSCCGKPKKPKSVNGRWPSNFLLQHHPEDNGECHPDCPVRLFDEQAGDRPAGGSQTGNEPSDKTNNVWGEYASNNSWNTYGDSGNASRMFHRADFSYEVAEQLAAAEPVRYEPKVSSSEREAGLDGLPKKFLATMNDGIGKREHNPDEPNAWVKNNHPTLKPISLTKYLATLLLPPAAYAPRRILVPFAGVGSEMAGAILAGWEEVIGIEREANYVKIAEARLEWWSQWPGWGQTDVSTILAAASGDDTGQMSLFEAA